MRLLLVAILAIHGLVHLLGFGKWTRRFAVRALTGRTLVPLDGLAARTFGVLWFVATLGFAAAALLVANGSSGWWCAALGAVVLSEALVVTAWPDAKYGTIANVILLVPIVAAAAHARFDRATERDVRAILAPTRDAVAAEPVALESLDRLPPPVRAWLVRAGVVGRPAVRALRLRQVGELRVAPDAPWMAATAEEHFSVDEPAFVWQVETTMMGFVPITGRDRFVHGQGSMRITAAALVPIVDARGDSIDSGAALRFLGEIIWFPSAALSRHVTWSAIDDHRAEATLALRGRRVSAVFSFDGLGRPTEVRALRYLGTGETAQLLPWTARCDAWRTFHGVEVPSHGVVTWTLPAGAFDYFRWHVTDVEYDAEEPGATDGLAG